VDWGESFRILSDGRGLEAPEVWAMAVHQAISQAALDMVKYGLSKTSTRTVLLSGGVFMNQILSGLCLEGLQSMGVKSLIHRNIPPNDGGVAVGQAYVGGFLINKEG